jgi:hypothetical protein
MDGDNRVCKRCKKDLPLNSNYFHIADKSKNTWKTLCKECCNMMTNDYRKIHKKEISENNKKYFKTHKKEISENHKKYHSENKEKCNARSKNYYRANKSYIRTKYKEKRDQYYKDNKERVLKRVKIYKIKNREKINQKFKERKKSDPMLRIKCNLRSRVLIAVKSQGAKKSKKTMLLLGCTIAHLRKHLESKFLEGMAWDNYGKTGWEIDHIVPCACFNLLNEDEQKKCFHWTNLQPMWQKDNSAKNYKYNGKPFRRNSIVLQTGDIQKC